ncbi:MAG: hypothetical protein CVU06_01980 [Bacteroidetes bacterium HGW-Bacteroidetes-22]|nr:MAG: hypothetical protein CVU06_01980 [Bacteroidetes bacterium HGW-Bacteroidetes-22]
MMDNRHDNIDQLFQQGLDGYDPTPSPKVWQGVSRDLSWTEFTKFNFTNFTHNIYLIGGSASALVGVILAAYLTFTGSPLPQQVKEPVSATQESLVKPIEVKTERYVTNMQSGVAVAKETSSLIPEKRIIRHETPQQDQIARSEQYIGTMTPKTTIAFKIDDTVKHDFWTRTWDKIAGLDGFYRHPGKFSVGVASGIDNFVQPMGDKANDYTFNSNTNQVKLRYENYGFQIETGLMLNKWEDKGLYDASYRDWDTVYSYVRVNYFIPDPTNPDSVVLIKETVYVFDSVSKTAAISATNKYTYLTIPLQFGYKLAEYGRFGVTAWVGGSISFESSRQISSPPIPPGARTRVSYTDITPERRTQWFMYNAGLRFDVMLSSRIQLEIEPYYRAYTKPVFTNGNLSNPHSLGINAGLSVKF